MVLSLLRGIDSWSTAAVRNVAPPSSLKFNDCGVSRSSKELVPSIWLLPFAFLLKHQNDIQIVISMCRTIVQAVKDAKERDIDDVRQRIAGAYKKEQWLPDIAKKPCNSLSLH